MPPDAALLEGLADRYWVRRTLGAGGMATVYLAEDRKHQREVAIKVLRPELAAAIGSERFLQEIGLTARLQHPHIVPLFDSGVAGPLLYYVMPYVAGETLRERLDRDGALAFEEGVRILTAIASALDYAHDHGVIHRDLKPENILLQHGVPMVADFGVALAAAAPGADRLTSVGMLVGTPAYMSPEQAAGDTTPDCRSDVYALGCVCYEMFAGHPPFPGDNARAVLARHVIEAAPRLTSARGVLPPGVAPAVARALAKNPAERFGSAGEFAASVGAPARRLPDGLPAILVLPFVNLSPEPGTEYLSDGLTEEIITDLATVSALRVIARSSAMRLKGTTRPIAEVARELECGYLVEGSVRQAGSSLRVTAQLVDVEGNAPIWAEKFSGTTADVFDMQEGVSRAVVAALRVKLTPGEHQALLLRPIADPRAQEWYLRAREELWSFTPAGVMRSVQYFRQGLSLIGDNVLLLRGLAEAYYQHVNIGLVPGQEAEYLARAEEQAARIFALEPGSPHGHLALVGPQLARGDVRGAARGLTRVVAASPNDPAALQQYAHVMSWLAGRPELARPLLGRLLQVDPLSPISRLACLSTPLFAGRFDEAIRVAEEAVALDPLSSFGRACHMIALGMARRFDEAADTVRELKPGPEAEFGAWMAGLYQAAWRGDADEVDRLMVGPYRSAADWDPELPYTIAQAHAAVGREDAALDWLERAIARGMINYPFMARWDWHLDPIRGTARFGGLLQRAMDEWVRFLETMPAPTSPG